jgi:hypothetical protein
MAGPAVLLYLLYVSSIDHWQLQVEFAPWEAPCAASASLPAMLSLAPSPTM